MSMDADNNDLQKYLDSFNKEIDESIQTVELDDEFESNNADGVDPGTDDNDKEENFFMDDSGNYYYQDPNRSVNITVEPQRKAPMNTVKFSPYKRAKNEGEIAHVKIEDINRGDANDGSEYVLILDGEGKEVYPEEINPDDPDDPDEDKEIYDFDENEDADEALTSQIYDTNLVQLKSFSKDGKDSTFKCLHCDYVVDKRYLLSRHMRTHSDDRPHKCSVCERTFKTYTSLNNHVNTHLGKKPHHCRFCQSAFATSGELVRHVRYKHTFEKPHKCSECEYASVELSKLKRHMRCHTGERPYQCPHCTYASPDTFKLKRHLRTHTGEKPYECDICHARFTQSNSMKAHRLIHSVGKKPCFQCSLCPTTCGRKTDLRLHIQKLHHSDVPIICKRCNKSCPDRYSYKLHVKTHEGEKCYRCDICPYASITLRHLQSHMLIHTDEKPFVCQFCDQSFRQKQLLKRHLNLYHNANYIPPKPRDKKHTCPDCKRVYSSKGNLIRHMEIHDPESNIKETKLKLTLGRKYRVVDGIMESILKTTNSDDDDDNQGDESDIFDETDVGFEAIEAIDEEENELEQKPVVQQSLLNMAAKHDIQEKALELPDITTVSIKKEPSGKEFVAVEGADGEHYVVLEVIQCDDDDEEDGEVEVETIEHHIEDQTDAVPNAIKKMCKMDVENCFGFTDEGDNDGGYVDEDFEDEEAIQLMEVIDD